MANIGRFTRLLTLLRAVLLAAAVAAAGLSAGAAQAATGTVRATTGQFTPGARWNDQNGNPLQLHGLGIVQAGSTWYGFGEDKTGETANDTSFQDIPCYSTTDLQHWTYQGRALSLQSGGDLGPKRIVERPKVIYNAATATYVMYVHIDNAAYSEAKVGVATSSTPCGPYTYRGSFQPLGFQSRDLSLFQEADGTAYLLSEDRANGLRIDRLSADYLSVGSSVALLPDYEAPAMARIGGTYYLLGSHLSGWSTNDNVYATAPSPAGPWSAFTGFATAGTSTYNSQTAGIIPVTGSAGTSYLYAGDRWDTSSLGTSPLIWLPITASGTTLNVGWLDSWSLDTAAGTWSATSSLPPAGSHTLTSSADSLLMDDSNNSPNDGNPVIQWAATGGSNQRWTLRQVAGLTYQVVNDGSGKCLDTSGSRLVQSTCGAASTTQRWLFDQAGDYTSPANTTFVVRNLASGLVIDVPGYSATQGTALGLWAGNGGSNQEWQVG
ncbi:RICIN domain-containing protein [Kitasatospora sp. NPDC006697]|uniref:RICIN domain-containing protein n=1 Tax=Kitasatospora sp. NPDC006697 TaxID=3364020 RepID=UPI0036BDA9A6